MGFVEIIEGYSGCSLSTSVVDLTGSVVDLTSVVPLDPEGLYYNHMLAIVPYCLVRLAQSARSGCSSTMRQLLLPSGRDRLGAAALPVQSSPSSCVLLLAAELTSSICAACS